MIDLCDQSSSIKTIMTSKHFTTMNLIIMEYLRISYSFIKIIRDRIDNRPISACESFAYARVRSYRGAEKSIRRQSLSQMLGLDHRWGGGWEGIRDAVSPENHSGHTSLTKPRERKKRRRIHFFSYLNRILKEKSRKKSRWKNILGMFLILDMYIWSKYDLNFGFF